MPSYLSLFQGFPWMKGEEWLALENNTATLELSQNRSSHGPLCLIDTHSYDYTTPLNKMNIISH